MDELHVGDLVEIQPDPFYTLLGQQMTFELEEADVAGKLAVVKQPSDMDGDYLVKIVDTGKYESISGQCLTPREPVERDC